MNFSQSIHFSILLFWILPVTTHSKVLNHPFELVPALSKDVVDSLQLFDPKNITIFEFKTMTLLLNTDGPALHKLDTVNGGILASFRPTQGPGPGELHKPRIVFLLDPYTIAIQNTANNQLVLLDENLVYLENLTVSWRGRRSVTVKDRLIIVNGSDEMMESHPLFDRSDRQKQVEQSQFRRDLRKKPFYNLNTVNLDPNWIFHFFRNINPADATYTVSVHAMTIPISNIPADEPQIILRGPPIDDLESGHVAGIKYKSTNFIDKVFVFQDLFLTQLQVTKSRQMLTVIDVYNKEGLFQKRFELPGSVYVLNSFSGPSTYVFLSEGIYRLESLDIDYRKK